jgi:hypothetical protein
MLYMKNTNPTLDALLLSSLCNTCRVTCKEEFFINCNSCVKSSSPITKTFPFSLSRESRFTSQDHFGITTPTLAVSQHFLT